jgi:hypothetical protein
VHCRGCYSWQPFSTRFVVAFCPDLLSGLGAKQPGRDPDTTAGEAGFKRFTSCPSLFGREAALSEEWTCWPATVAPPGWRSLPLTSFATDPDRREDMRAYARVLMYPFASKLVAGYSDKAWVMDYGIPAGDISYCEEKYLKYLKGFPGLLNDAMFYAIAEWVLNGTPRKSTAGR